MIYIKSEIYCGPGHLFRLKRDRQYSWVMSLVRERDLEKRLPGTVTNWELSLRKDWNQCMTLSVMESSGSLESEG